MTTSARPALTCREAIEFLSAYLAGELSPEEGRTFDAHLAECPDCVDYLRTYKDAVTLAKGAFDSNDPLPADMPDKLVQAILAARRKGVMLVRQHRNRRGCPTGRCCIQYSFGDPSWPYA